MTSSSVDSPHSSGTSRPGSRVIVVTGASDGIGRAAVRAFARQGATVVMVGRNEAKTAAAARAIMSETGSRTITWHIADLSQQHEVREVAGVLRKRHPRIDVLCNNAGALFLERETTGDGLERTFALNHLAYFTLTFELLPALRAAARAPVTADAPARIVNVSSRAHQNARIDLDDLQMTRRWSGWRAYCNSKLCNIWFTRELARRLAGEPVIVHAMHPGVVSTRFASNNGRMGRFLRRVMDLRSVTPEQGADTLVWLASGDDPQVTGTSGRYWYKRRDGSLSRAARDDDRARMLWVHSAMLTGIDVGADAGVAVGADVGIDGIATR
ncbi:SDR family NAD(P)-dependent oxidoreductase [Gemmatimonas aurantiaca]|uniref:SDR family NAD(P)-dependent oxidoreductase n=1 Tax=Gemmatimonas aurantiaca TaxID=173480 RepID=UPI00301CF429